MARSAKPEPDHVTVDSEDALWAWLGNHHDQDEGVWLVTFKKSAPDASDAAKYLSTDQILDALLAYGWIDGFRRKIDEARTKQMIYPRKAQHWARSYKERAERLIAEGRMQPPGLVRMEADKTSGLWQFMDDVDNLVVPDDLAQALDAHSPAATKFAAMGEATQRFALRWIKLAKTDPTRAKRIRITAERAARGEKVPGA